MTGRPMGICLISRWGAYPDLPRNCQLHKLKCYCYTIGTITAILVSGVRDHAPHHNGEQENGN